MPGAFIYMWLDSLVSFVLFSRQGLSPQSLEHSFHQDIKDLSIQFTQQSSIHTLTSIGSTRFRWVISHFEVILAQ
jgi:hypothetical protein